MTMTRRCFVQMIGAVVALIKAPIPAIADSLPRLVGDGIHNDAPALNALLNRLPIEIGPLVNVNGAGWKGDTLFLPCGNFAVHESVIIGCEQSDMHLNASGCTLIVSGEVDYAIRVTGAERVQVSYLHIDTAPDAKLLAAARIEK